MRRRLFAELLGAMLLTAAVIGSGIMGQRLAGGNGAVALLANTGATVAALAVLIALLGPISGAHFNPAVSLAKFLSRQMSLHHALLYAIAQVVGCLAGTLLAHAMFELPLVQSATHARTGMAQWLSELVATAGLIVIVQGCESSQQACWRVPAWIGAAYWFTASTSFANPAITVARSLSDTFAGVRPDDVPGFIVAQLLGVLVGLTTTRLLRQ
jgi:glycerol uptake facilitator-like aquaporin